jgi:hypothetical protein
MCENEGVPLRWRFVSENEQRQAKALALLECSEVDGQIVLLRKRLIAFGETLNKIAGFLRDGNPRKYLYELSFPDKKEIDNVAKALEAAEMKARQLREQLGNLGGIPANI